MNEQLALQKLLRERLVEIQRENPRYSLRAFSRKLGVHVGALTYIMNGKRNVSRALAERIATRLLLDPQSRSELLRLFPDKRRKAASEDGKHGPRYLEMNAAQFKVAAEWEHFAVLSLIKCDDFQGTSEWISNRLGITSSRSRDVVQRLLQLGLLEIGEDGQLTRTAESFRTPDDFADISLKKHHDQTLELAKVSLYRDDVALRDFTTITMSIDPRKISMAKERVRSFQDDLSALLESGTQTEVYRLSMQLFPLSRINSGEDHETL